MPELKHDAELEALLTEVPSGLDPLEALFQEAKASIKDAQAAKDARERIKRGMGSAKDKAADEERIRRWELANEWKSVASVALFERYRCACGRQQTIFRQFMERQEHRHLRGSMRWQKVEELKIDLPQEIAVQKWETPICTECSETLGFAFRPGKVTEWQA